MQRGAASLMIGALHRSYLTLRTVGAWLQRRFTPAGGFVLAGLALTATASDPDTMGLSAFVLLFAMLSAAWLVTPFFRARFAVERQAPRFVTAGEPFTLRVRVENLSNRAQRGLEYLENVRDPLVTPAEFAARLRPGRGNRSFRIESPLPPIRPARVRPEPIPVLPSRGHIELRIEIVAYRRGPLVLTGGWLARTDPFGLVRAFSRTSAPQTVLVLPRRYPLPPLSLPGQSQYQRGGVSMAAGVGESEEFVALREYRHGDSLRRVHWRSSARRGRLIVKECQDEHFVRHALVLDTFCEASRDALFEEAVAVAASFACTVPDQASLLDLLFVGPKTVCVTSGRGVGHVQQMLEVLAAVKPCRESRLAELESLVLDHSPVLSGCLLVLLEWDEPRRALIRRLRALRVPVLAMILLRPGENRAFDPGAASDQPDHLLRLESGRVGEGLQRLGEMR